MRMRFAFPRRATAVSVAAALAIAAPAAFAEDVDIFTAGAGTISKPNVLIVLDSSSNWSATLGPNTCNTGNMADNTKFAAEICALRLVTDAIPSDVRMGLMMFAESGNNGGYVRFGIRDMTAANKTAFKSMLGNFFQSGVGTDNSGSNQPYAKTMFEVFKYFGGGDGTGTPQDSTHFGNATFAGGASNNAGSYRRDYDGNNSGSATAAAANRAAMKYGASAPFALSGSSSNNYDNPINDNCSKNFVVFISNGNPGTGGDSGSPDALTLLGNIGGDTTAAGRVRSAGAEVHASLMDEFARHLYVNDISPNPDRQRIITYTIAVYQPNPVTGAISNTDQQMIKLMKSAAGVGGGKYFAATNAADVVVALLTILNEVQAVNSVFVSASLPVSVNTQGTFLNQVYMGLFRPDGSGSPRWMGNVKEYKFIQDSGTGDIFLADSLGKRAVASSTGFLSPSAISFWTSDSTFWAGSPSGTPPSKSDSPDGEVVEKGGAAEQIRNKHNTSQASRRVITCPLGGCGPDTAIYDNNDFNTTTIAGNTYETAFGASAAELPMLVNWIRGEDNAIGATVATPKGDVPCDSVADPVSCTWGTAEFGPGWPTTVRPSVHGDVLHSRPVVLNYEDIGPVIFYGANDGTLRATKGGQAADDGHEFWAFVAPEFYAKFKRQRLGFPELRTPGTPPALIPFTLPKDYFFDGPIGAWEDTTTTPTTRWIFPTARRGGRVIYAIDVTNPEKPIVKWKKTEADLVKLGQSWSLPVAFKITGVSDPFLVFGAGYDAGEDLDPIVNNLVGRGIYVLNANDGSELAFFETAVGGAAVSSPIASDMGFLAKPLAAGGFGDVYRGYVGDLDGNVWRLDIPNGTVADWKLFKFATLGAGYKILYAPDLVRAGDRDVVLIGSGDREKPLLNTTSDRFWALADLQNATTAAVSMTPLTTADLQLLSGDTGFDATACPTCKGWYRNLAVGEKVVNSPLTVAGVTYFATNKPTPPSPGSCATNLGEAKAYGLSFLTGAKPAGKSSISTTLTGGGLPPSPVGGVVELEPGKLVTFVIGTGAGGSPIEPTRPPLIVPRNRSKIYWNMKSDG